MPNVRVADDAAVLLDHRNVLSGRRVRCRCPKIYALNSPSSVSFFCVCIAVIVVVVVIAIATPAEMIIHLYRWTFIAVFYCAFASAHPNILYMLYMLDQKRGRMSWSPCYRTCEQLNVRRNMRAIFLRYCRCRCRISVVLVVRSKLPTSLFPVRQREANTFHSTFSHCAPSAPPSSPVQRRYSKRVRESFSISICNAQKIHHSVFTILYGRKTVPALHIV